MKRRVFFLLCVFLLLYGYTFAQTPFNMVILTDEDSLTIYIPATGLVSLQGMAFRVDDGSGPKIYTLENYASFRGLPYDTVPVPICFRLVRDTSNRVAPQDCQNSTLLIQKLAAADVFWYDATTNVSRLITIMQGSTPQAICPSGNPRCNIMFAPPTLTPIPPTSTATVTPSSTATPEVTATPTLDPEMEIAQRGVLSNAEWAPYSPYIQEINGIEMVLVPAGCFEMGKDGEGGRQCFDAPFWISRYEVTNVQYKACVDARACTLPGDRIYYDDSDYANHPVVFVDWFQVTDYATWAGMRLPTEAEWEYAARGPDELVYPWGNTFDVNLVNFCDVNCEFDWRDADFDDGYAMTAPVGSYPGGTSWVAALDISGNVVEWVSSLYLEYPYDGSHESVSNTDDNRARALRGGSWNVVGDFLRAANRYRNYPSNRYNNIGFRCALSL